MATPYALQTLQLHQGHGATTGDELHGFDISPDSFIDADYLPRNVQLHVTDARDAPAAQFKGYFDIVHIRLVQSVVENNDPRWMIEHCKALLRPGGHLQWEEFDPLGLSLNDSGKDCPALRAMVNTLRNRAPSTWIAGLPEQMKDAGMHVTVVERKPESIAHRSSVTQITCMVLGEYADHVGGNEGAKIKALVQNAHSEVARGAFTPHLFQTVIATAQVKATDEE